MYFILVSYLTLIIINDSNQFILLSGRLFAYINPIQSTATYGDVLVQIQCFVTGIPVADTWYWTRKPLNGGPITTIGKGTDSADYIVDNSPTSPSLTILGITKADEADYTCYATNAAGTSSSSSSRLYVNGGNNIFNKYMC